VRFFIDYTATLKVGVGSARPSLKELRSALNALAKEIPVTARVTVTHRANDAFTTEVVASWWK
jgi:hypothetical protein